MLGDFKNLYSKWDLDGIAEALINPPSENKEKFCKNNEILNLDKLSDKYDKDLRTNVEKILELNYGKNEKMLENILEIIFDYASNQKLLCIKYIILSVKKIIHIFI